MTAGNRPPYSGRSSCGISITKQAGCPNWAARLSVNSPFMKANYFAYINSAAINTKSTTTLRNNYRWAEPDNGNGVSGPHNAVTAKGGITTARINNHATPRGGGDACPWSLNNCGPNDEPFSFHTGGALAAYGDGHVQFLRDSITAQVLRAICTPDGAETLSAD